VEIPSIGLSREALFQALESYKAHDVRWRSGRVWGYVYDAGREVEEVAKQAYTLFLTENALDPTIYPSLLRLENELVGMLVSHLGGDGQVVGHFTTGGTESILLAAKAARDYFRATRPGVGEPEMLLPLTAHAAFHKAAHYLNLRAVAVPVDPRTFKADVEATKQAITPNTILLVASAPSYAHGVIDPIRDLGELAAERGLLFHVDACIGGFLLPYFRRLGAPVPDFDFRVPGVTSISVDLHKYAYAAKGASLVLYRSRDLRRHQLFTCARWPGYSVVNPTVQSSKTGGPLAAAWAVLHLIGDDGYLRIAQRLLEATRRLVAGIEQIDGLRVLGKPEMSLVAFASDTVSVFHIADEMKTRGWYIQPQLAFGGGTESLHVSVTPSSVPHVEALLADLRASVEAARALPSGGPAARVQAALAQLDLANPSPEALAQLMQAAGVLGAELPKRMAPINEILNALPTALRERLLVEFFDRLYSPPGAEGLGSATGG
jgi:glutamate/tyrosine decarboxylase-like PLP-dependent enzyme